MTPSKGYVYIPRQWRVSRWNSFQRVHTPCHPKALYRAMQGPILLWIDISLQNHEINVNLRSDEFYIRKVAILHCGKFQSWILAMITSDPNFHLCFKTQEESWTQYSCRERKESGRRIEVWLSRYCVMQQHRGLLWDVAVKNCEIETREVCRERMDIELSIINWNPRSTETTQHMQYSGSRKGGNTKHCVYLSRVITSIKDANRPQPTLYST